jgi:hypothetical protein
MRGLRAEPVTFATMPPIREPSVLVLLTPQADDGEETRIDKTEKLGGTSPMEIAIWSSSAEAVLSPEVEAQESSLSASAQTDVNNVQASEEMNAERPSFSVLENYTCSLNLLCYRSGPQGCVR